MLAPEPAEPDLPSRDRTLRWRRWLAWTAAAGLSVAGLGAAFAPGATVPPTDGASAAFCLTGPLAAQVVATDRRDRSYDVRVPAVDPQEGIPASATRPIAKGDVVEFRVASDRPGTLAVHGLTDLKPVVVGGVATVAFRAIYTGRFPLHFHGTDGSHIEIAALDVMPAPAGVDASTH
jgi:hypothetical protein